MRSNHETYQRHLRKRLNAKGYAVWPPGRVLKLGDIGELGRGGDFQKRTDLQQLGIKVKIERGKKQPMMSATSDEVRTAEAGAGVAAATVAKACGRVSFGRAGAAIFEVQDFQHVQLGNLDEIADRVVALWGQKQWQRPWCLVDQVWRAGAGTIIVAVSKDAEVRVEASAAGAIPGLTALADPALAASIEVHSTGVTQVIGGRDLTPMFTCMRLDFFKSNLKRISTRSPDDEPASPRLVRLSLDDIETAWRDADAAGNPGE